LTTSLQTSTQPDQERCLADGRPNFTAKDYSAVLLTPFAEAPGLVVAAFLIDTKGRIWCLRGGLFLCSACILGLLLVSSHVAQLILLFAARACIEGTFSVLYVYTPELYPTTIRSFALALCNAFSRLGGLAAPFVTVYLVEKGHTRTAVTLLSMLCFAAALGASVLKFETRGRDLNAVHLSDQQSERGSDSTPIVGEVNAAEEAPLTGENNLDGEETVIRPFVLER